MVVWGSNTIRGATEPQGVGVGGLKGWKGKFGGGLTGLPKVLKLENEIREAGARNAQDVRDRRGGEDKGNARKGVNLPKARRQWKGSRLRCLRSSLEEGKTKPTYKIVVSPPNPNPLGLPPPFRKPPPLFYTHWCNRQTRVALTLLIAKLGVVLTLLGYKKKQRQFVAHTKLPRVACLTSCGKKVRRYAPGERWCASVIGAWAEIGYRLVSFQSVLSGLLVLVLVAVVGLVAVQ